MKLSRTFVFCAAPVAAAALFTSSASAQAIANGSLTGLPTVGSPPAPWYNWQFTPDTVDAFGPFNNTITPWTASPDGGTFVRGNGSVFVDSEAFAQVVTGLTIGQAYSINVFQTNLGLELPSVGSWLGEDGFWSLVVDGSLEDSTSVISKQPFASDAIIWSGDSLDFVATATSHELAFVSRSVQPNGITAYMGIDGLRLQAVPAPGVVSTLALGGLALARRRRAGSFDS